MVTESQQLLTLQEAATAVGCHYQTLYRHVRKGELKALMVGGTYRIERRELEFWLSERDARLGAVPQRSTRNWAKQGTSLLDALLAGDAKAARQQNARLLAGGVTVADLCDYLYAPTLTQIGLLWTDHKICVAEEHRASRIVEALLDHNAAGTGKPGPRIGNVVVASPAGDRHSLAPQMVAAGLHAEGFRVSYLGADLPVGEIVQMAEREHADLVAISCCVADHSGLSDLLAQLTAAEFPTLVGGTGIGKSEALKLGATRYGASINEAQALARQLVRSRAD
jgi:excisionase family DNA binding protein